MNPEPHQLQFHPPMVSVIIAVYGVEDFLAQCLDSVLGQTYGHLDVVLVDDGSPDASPAICDSYAAKDPRVRVIHQSNAGVSAARNTGLAAASGQFVTFLDPDDWWAPTFVESLMNALAAEPSAGIALTSFALVPGDEYRAPNPPSGVLSPSESVSQFAGPHHTLFAVVWGKVFQRDLLDGVSFPEGRLHEDEFTTYRLLLRAPTAVVPEPLYLYRQRPGSITGAVLTPERLLDALDAADQQVADFVANGHDRAASWAAGQSLRKRLRLISMLRAEGRHAEAQHHALLLRRPARVRLSTDEPCVVRALDRLARRHPDAAARAYTARDVLARLRRSARPA